MSIWRTISCPNCDNEFFEIADNGFSFDIRFECIDCKKTFYLIDGKIEIPPQAVRDE